ncbi:acylphosphatase [Yimella sp. cx-51]|uniref:acylphosphatase n=1 Tax=Yimella sp. cx-51 TaxID=2770551 RepID=UPI00165D62C3|nr:acylphosphatase [Yimella sp. cx-51]MBC9957216.1 acylphosphatase [Yimella sp. cx-51]MBD2758531.1 acylphosphatase [Yimella sp. cx-573]QTH37138.1 acylphosphatase [Yimella sp. cx-51]
MLRAVEVRITGRVQGVFFRASCAEYARQLGVRGWVRNEPDGSVLAHFEGGWTSIEEILEWCRKGPRRADVEDVEVSKVAPIGAEGFDVDRH